MIYRFRITLNGDETTFRDIEIEASNSFEDFHNVILQSFGFDGMEMASFYLADEDWEPIEEITLFDMSEDEEADKKLIMSEYQLEDMLNENQARLVYIYDFLSLWTFMVELVHIAERDETVDYPNLLFAQGQLDFSRTSEDPLEENFENDLLDLENDNTDIFDNNDLFDDLENFDDFDSFEDNWN